jgi:hypothetical protein
MKKSEVKEFQLVYQAEVPGKTAIIRTGIVVGHRAFGEATSDYYVLPLDTWNDDFWKAATPKNFQSIEKWHRTKEEAVEDKQLRFSKDMARKSEQTQEGLNALNDLREQLQ